ncbi:MAG: SH3 domain-containing protein [Nitrososphaerales archaeon]
MASTRTTSEDDRERASSPGNASGSEPVVSPREPGPRIIPLRDGPGPAPGSGALPPPDRAEALYYEGMAAYQHRHWEEALDRFTRLKELQPSRPGLDALLDEVRWFLQLQAAAPPGEAPGSGAGGDAASGAHPTWGRRLVWRLGERSGRVRAALYIVLGVLAVADLLSVAFRDYLPWRSNSATEDLYNSGQTRLAVGDYEGAQAAFEKMLEVAPNDPEAQVGLDSARRQQELTQGYAAAEAAIAEENWDRADVELTNVLAIDPTYHDAQAWLAFVNLRRKLAGLYADGARLYDLGQWEQALKQFERVQSGDASYRTETVNEFLFVCYLNAGEALLKFGGGSIDNVKTAVDYFGRALAIHPRNLTAADARRLGDGYLGALQALAENDRKRASAQLAALVLEAPGYAGGRAAGHLYNLTVALGQDALAAGDIANAIEYFARAQELPVIDTSAARHGLMLAQIATPTASPTPPHTPTATSVPTPWASILAGPLSARSGPGSAYPVVGEVAQEAAVVITGRRDDGAWLRVCCTTGGKEAWVPSPSLHVQGPLEEAEVVSEPTATATRAVARPTRTPLSTATPKTDICVQGRVLDVAGGEPLSGWPVTLVDATGVQRTWRTSASGFYRFSDIVPGPAILRIDVAAGWQSVSPIPTNIVTVPATDCALVDFWVQQVPEPTPVR